MHNKYMKSSFSFIRKIQIKIIIRYRNIDKFNNIKCEQRCGGRTFMYWGRSVCKLMQPL